MKTAKNEGSKGKKEGQREKKRKTETKKQSNEIILLFGGKRDLFQG